MNLVRIKTIRDKWFNAPFAIQHPLHPTCDSFIQSLATRHPFVAPLGELFDAAAAGRPIEPQTLKLAATILAHCYHESIAMAEVSAAQTTLEKHLADSYAADRSLNLVAELAKEIGIRLPVNTPRSR